MNKKKIILIAVCAVVAAAVVIGGVLYGVRANKAPELDEEKLLENPINDNTAYVVGQPPYTDKWVFDTPMGMNNYWLENHTGGSGMEIVLQQSRDGELVALSEALPAKSNSEILFGKDAAVKDLTLEELRMINLAYNLVNADGETPYADFTDDALADVSVVTLDEALTYFGAPNKITVKLYLRFFDESQIDDMSKALQTIYAGLQAQELLTNAVFCPQSDESAQTADKVCPEMLRAATEAEAKALYSDCMRDKAVGTLPYDAIYEKADARFGKEKFIRIARNLGLAVVLSGIKPEQAVRYCEYGVTAIATDNAGPIIQILTAAEKADLE